MRVKSILGITLMLAAATGLVHSGAHPSKPSAASTPWVTVRTVKQVPAPVLLALQARFTSDKRLADVGEPFDPTDVLTGLPQRRLVLAGHTATEWFVAYEHGGRAHHLDLVVLNTQGNVPVPVAAFEIDAGVHDDANGWRLTLADLEPVLQAS